MHTYFLHLSDAVHARFVLAECAELRRYPVKRRSEENVTVLKAFVLVMRPDVKGDFEDRQQRENPLEVNDRYEEKKYRIRLCEGRSGDRLLVDDPVVPLPILLIFLVAQ